jgi:hypothetical protein
MAWVHVVTVLGLEKLNLCGLRPNHRAQPGEAVDSINQWENAMDTQVYRGKPELVHVTDGQRVKVGEAVASVVDDAMRSNAFWTAPTEEAMTAYREDKQLCPGCYMVVLFNAAVTLAKRNGQSLTELGRSMACAFDTLSKGGPDAIESIQVKLDSDGDVCELVSNGNG